MYCSQCGNKLRPGKTFCLKCGEINKETSASNNSHNPQLEKGFNNLFSKKWIKRTVIAMSIFFVYAIIAEEVGNNRFREKQERERRERIERLRIESNRKLEIQKQLIRERSRQQIQRQKQMNQNQLEIYKILGDAFTLPSGLPSSGRSGGGGGSCYQVASFVAPDPLGCTQVGTDYLGQAIWTCCN